MLLSHSSFFVWKVGAVIIMVKAARACVLIWGSGAGKVHAEPVGHLLPLGPASSGLSALFSNVFVFDKGACCECTVAWRTARCQTLVPLVYVSTQAAQMNSFTPGRAGAPLSTVWMTARSSAPPARPSPSSVTPPL